MATSSPSLVTTSYLLSNLHCPSCVAHIKSVLTETYGDAVPWVSPNLVTSVVTVEHINSPKASVENIKITLEEAGFDICGIRSDSSMIETVKPGASPYHAEGSRSKATPLSPWSRFWKTPNSISPASAAAEAHVQNCKACQLSINGSGHEAMTAENKADTLAFTLTPPVDSLDFKDALAEVMVTEEDGPGLRATLAIGGMTCVACVQAITSELQKRDGIDKVTVNLLTNSATVQYRGSHLTTGIVEAIEDLGYDAVVDKVVDLGSVGKHLDEREMEIKIDGMFCYRCTDRISQTLTTLSSSGNITVVRAPSLEDNILKIRYVPRTPDFTIRHILRAIAATDDNLSPTIYHPPTLEERSKAVKARYQRQLLWREVLTIVVAIPTFILGIVYMSLVPKSNASRQYLMSPWTNGLSRNDVALAILSTPVYLFSADVFHIRAIKEIRAMWRRGSKTPILARFCRFGSMNMLMSLGTTIAYVSSLVQMIVAAGVGRPTVTSGELYFDSVVFLTMFLLAGRLIEAYSKSKTGDAVEALAKLRPSTALLVNSDKRTGETVTEVVDQDQLECGDLVRVPRGSSPPADGIVAEGESSFDESSLTGESRPVMKREGDEVYAGTVNKAEAIVICITKTGGKSMLDQIVEVVREGQTKRAPMEQVADTLTTYFVPAITLVALITFAVWIGLAFTEAVPGQKQKSSGSHVAFALRFSIAVFVVACPCGLGLAAPTAIFVGGGLAAEHGILAKGGGEAFEKASKVKCVVFDKTGTLTVGGAPRITDSVMFPDGNLNGVDQNCLKSAMRALEENSNHPIASAIVDFCRASTEAVDLSGIQEQPGKGMTAICTNMGFDIAIGNELHMRDTSVGLSDEVLRLLQTWKMEAKSITLVGVRLHSQEVWELAAALSISDPLRPEAASVVQTLRSSGIQVWMLSGDNAITAKAVASLVGIDSANVLAEVLPSEKAVQISYLQAAFDTSPDAVKRRRRTPRAMLAMVGDGINDSPALTQADIGIAVGSGSDVAISSADFVLASSNLTSVLTLLELSHTIFRRIKFNFGWAMVYNLLAVPVAAGCLYAVQTSNGSRVTLDPVWASLAMALSSISVILSSLSLKLKLPGIGFRPSIHPERV